MDAGPPEAKQAFGPLLRQLRRRSGLTQETLAERAGISARAVSDLERGGNRVPRSDTLHRLAAALSLSPEQQAQFIAAARGETVSAPLPAAQAPTTDSLARLPIPATQLIGREGDLTHLLTLIRSPEARLITLTGPGGVGKTRLALAAGQELIQGGNLVFWVDLSALRESGLVAAAIHQALGLRQAGSDTPETQLIAHLRERRILLLLDNFEHVMEAATLLSSLLAACPTLCLLVTSRAALRLRGEHEVSVAPLALPQPARLPPLTELAETPAIRLFMQRARAVAPDTVLSAATAPVIVEICRRLDGLPLAIELAASRSKLFPPQVLLKHLTSRLALMVDGPRDAPARQHTLRQTLDWSYGLLGAAERQLFRRLSVFAGGWTLEAAEAVCEPAAEGDVVRRMSILLDHSLIRRLSQSDGEPRYGMLETIREYGLEQLSARSEAVSMTGAHALYFHDLAKAAEPELTGPAQAQWLARLEAEHDNLRAALAWSLAGGLADRQAAPERVGTGLRLAGNLWRFWSIRGYAHEGRAWLERLLAVEISAGSKEITASRAAALRGAAALAYGQGDFTWSVGWAEEGLALYQSLNDRQGIVRALQILAVSARDQGDLLRALHLHEHALKLYRDLGDSYGISVTLHNLGLVARDQGDYSRAAAFYAESLAIKRSLGERAAEAMTLNNLADLAVATGDLAVAEAYAEEAREIGQRFADKNALAYAFTSLGEIALLRGDFTRARTFQRQCLALRRELGDKRGEAGALTNLGHLAHRRRNHRQANALFRESLLRHQHLGPSLDLVECLGGLAQALQALGEPARATYVLGAMTTLFQSLRGNALLPSYVDPYEQTLAFTRAVLGDDAFTAAWSAGVRLPVDQIFLLATQTAPRSPTIGDRDFSS